MIARSPLPRPAIAGDVLQGLSRTPKSLPPKLFYDAAGSALFDRITTLPEYYLTRCEMEILQRSGAEICDAIGGCGQVVEFGPGNGSKAEALLRRLAGRQLRTEYVPLDISREALAEAARRITGAFSGVRVRPQVADFSRPFTLPNGAAGRLVLYLGSSIGNLDEGDARELLRRIRRALRPGDKLLLGADLVKPARVLLAAYDDAQGVTAAFNKNVLARINRELGGGFDLDSFRHVALWNRAAGHVYARTLNFQIRLSSKARGPGKG